MTGKSNAIIDSIDLNEVEIEDEGFFPEYEVEVYWDVRLYNAQGTDYSGEIGWAGNSVCPTPYVDENGSVIELDFAAEIQKVIRQGLDDEDRIGPVYVTC